MMFTAYWRAGGRRHGKESSPKRELWVLLKIICIANSRTEAASVWYFVFPVTLPLLFFPSLLCECRDVESGRSSDDFGLLQTSSPKEEGS